MLRFGPLPHTLLAGAISFWAASTVAQPTEEPPSGVEQIIPRGAIPAVLQPRFVTAAEAEMPDDAWVLGVVIDGKARAYSLNLLNRHEIVNDRIGKKAFAAVW
jgi:hypothetical protein